MMNSIFIQLFTTILITPLVEFNSDCEFDSAAYMPNGYFFLSRGDRFLITNGRGLAKFENITEKCRSSKLTRVDLAVWWGRNTSDHRCEGKNVRNYEGYSLLLRETLSKDNCKWCFLFNKEEKVVGKGGRVLKAWNEKVRPFHCDDFMAMAMTNATLAQLLTLITRTSKSDSTLLIWNCKEKKKWFDARNRIPDIIWQESEIRLNDNFVGRFSNKGQQGLLTIYANESDYVFVSRNGSRLSCSTYNLSIVSCHWLTNLYEFLNITCERGAIDSSTYSNHPSSQIPVTTKTETIITSSSPSTTKKSTTTTKKKLTTRNPAPKTVDVQIIILMVFFILALIFVIVIAFVAMIYFYWWLKKGKRKARKRKRSQRRGSFISETMSEMSEGQMSGATFPFDVTSHKSSNSDSDDSSSSSKQLLL